MPIVVPADDEAVPGCGFSIGELAQGYLKLDDWDAAVLGDAVLAEWNAQVARCRFPLNDAGNPTLATPFATDLQQALKRRVARNLAMRGIPLGVQFDDAGGQIVGANDPEVRRLEAPHRRVTVA